MRILGLSLGLGALLLGCSTRSVDQPATAVPSTLAAATAQPVQAAPSVSAAPAGSASAAASSAPVAPVAVVAPAPPGAAASVAEPVTAGPPHSRQDYLYRTARLRAQVRPPQVQRPADLPGEKAETAPTAGPPKTLGAPKRLLYSGPSDKAPKELLTRPDVYCELSPGGNVRFFGP
jgi:hypothetical protein